MLATFTILERKDDVSGAVPERIRVWSFVSPNIPSTYSSFPSIALSGDGRHVAVGDPNYSDDGREIRVFSCLTEERQEQQCWQQRGQTLTTDQGASGHDALSLSEDGNILAAGILLSDNQIQVLRFDGETDSWMPMGSPMKIEHDDGYSIYGSAVDLSADGHTISIRYEKIQRPFMRIDRFRNDTNDWQLGGHASDAAGVSLSQDGSRVAVFTISQVEHVDASQSAVVQVFDYVNTGARKTRGRELGTKWSIFAGTEHGGAAGWTSDRNTHLTVSANSCHLDPLSGTQVVVNQWDSSSEWELLLKNAASSGACAIKVVSSSSNQTWIE